MKKKLVLMTALLLVLLSAVGCGNNSLGDYKKAVDKTDQITKGQTSGEFALTLDFNTDGMAQEDITDLNYYRDMSGSFQAAFDQGKGQGIYRNYMSLGGLGLDFDLYYNGDQMFIKLPIVGKYMEINDILKETGQLAEDSSAPISKETVQTLGEEWIGILKEEDVFKGKDIILTTPDGEVKTTVYTITLNEAQVKALEEKAVTVLSEDENLKKNFESLIKAKACKSEAVSFDEFTEKIKEMIARDTVERFQYTAYVDIDGYIVNEIIEVKTKRENPEIGEPRSVNFRLEQKSWEINRDQEFDFPVLTEENTMKTDDLDETMPSVFKDLFRKPESKGEQDAES